MRLNHVHPAQSLLELIVAIGIILASTFAAVTLIISTISAGRVSQNKIEAANLAREGVEIVRGIRDSNWLKRAQNQTITAGGLLYEWNTGLENGQYIARYYYNNQEWVLEQFIPVNERNHDSRVALQENRILTQQSGISWKYTKFYRFIDITRGTEYILDGQVENLTVESTVRWEDHGDKEYKTTEILYDWKQ